MRHEPAKRLDFVEHARLPGRVQRGRIVGHAVLIRINLHRVAVDVPGQPRLGGHDVVEEDAVGLVAARDPRPVRIARLVLRHCELGQVDAI